MAGEGFLPMLRSPPQQRHSRSANSSSTAVLKCIFVLSVAILSGCLVFLALTVPTQRGWLLHADSTSAQTACPRCPQAQVLSTAHYLHNPRRYHTITTTAGFSNHWQVRVHYYWFKRQREICEAQAVCDMGGFTRLLHTGLADDLMDEIPTVVVDPLPKGVGDDSYIVLNRPYAFNEWLKKASVPERYILMCESDHLHMRPLPNLMPGEQQAAALFTYINPIQYPEIVKSLIGNVPDSEVGQVPRTGNSPTFISVRDFKKLAPAWFNATMDIWKDPVAHKTWNWVLEMYAYAIASYRTGLHKGMLLSDYLLAHPPFDTKETVPSGNPFYLLHLTYPIRYNAAGKMVEDERMALWVFDKRRYLTQAPPRNLAQPPLVVRNDLARLAIEMLNEATENIPCWDTYVAKRLVTTDCSLNSLPAS